MKTNDVVLLLKYGLIPRWITDRWNQLEERSTVKIIEGNQKDIAVLRTGYIFLIVLVFLALAGAISGLFGGRNAYFGIAILLVLMLITVVHLRGVFLRKNESYEIDEPLMEEVIGLANAMRIDLRTLLGLEKSQAEKKCREILTVNAGQIVKLQEELGNVHDTVIELRAKFKHAHLLFVKFGLAANDWGIYFKQANYKTVLEQQ